jgi:hypothetical protein
MPQVVVISTTCGNRGDWRLTFPNDSLGQALLQQSLAQALDFTADAFLATSNA